MRKAKTVWHLREVMASRGLYSTTAILPLLAERGIELSATHAYRLVVQGPERLNLDVLAALCDGLQCGPQDLLEVVVVEGKSASRRVHDAGQPPEAPAIRPTRARIVADG